MNGFFAGSSDLADSTRSSTTSTDSEEETDSSHPSKQDEQMPQQETLLSADEAFREVEGPPRFLDLQNSGWKSHMEQRKRKLREEKEDAVEEKEVEKKKSRCIVFSAEPVTYTTPQMTPPVTLPPAKGESKKDSSKSMEVSEFLTKGGGVMLPRNTRKQRDKEKSKREKGQSSHSKWKSEEEMLMRQQYD